MTKPIDTTAIRGVCDLRSNNLDYWRDTARKFTPELADEIDRLRAEVIKYETLITSIEKVAGSANNVRLHGEPGDWSAVIGKGYGRSVYNSFDPTEHGHQTFRKAMQTIALRGLGIDIRFADEEGGANDDH